MRRQFSVFKNNFSIHMSVKSFINSKALSVFQEIPTKKTILNWRFTKNIPKNISSAKKRETTNLH